MFTSTVQYSRQFTDSVSMLDQFASTVVKPIDTNLSTAAVDPDPVVTSDAPAMTFGFNSYQIQLLLQILQRLLWVHHF